jgi:hypothetical protein
MSVKITSRSDSRNVNPKTRTISQGVFLLRSDGRPFFVKKNRTANRSAAEKTKKSRESPWGNLSGKLAVHKFLSIKVNMITNRIIRHNNTVSE